MSAESLRSVLEDKNRVIRRHSIEWHRKITLSLACIILFLIGAPLGAIIRKGGAWYSANFCDCILYAFLLF